jgi:NAD+ diphosphatase
MKYIENNPIFAFCPKCGSSSFICVDGERSFRCEMCNFHYFINNSAAVACLIFNSLGELLLTRRALEPNKGMLDLPGGFVEPMETAEETVVREIMEELNLVVIKMRYLVSFPNLYTYSNFDVPTIDLAFLCKTENFIDLRPGDDVASVEFMNPKFINLEAFCSESMRQIVRFYIDMTSSE